MKTHIYQEDGQGSDVKFATEPELEIILYPSFGIGKNIFEQLRTTSVMHVKIPYCHDRTQEC